MSGSNQKNSSDSYNRQSGEEDPLKEFTAAISRLSISGQNEKNPNNCTKFTLSMHPGAVSVSQVKTLKRHWDNVSTEGNIQFSRHLDCTSPSIKKSKIKTKVAGKSKVVYVYKQEEPEPEPEPTIAQEEENIECKKTDTTEEAEKKDNAKARRGGVTHKWVL
ncbi:hypothetical protein PAMP_014927 [Pampus punctatissimus]